MAEKTKGVLSTQEPVKVSGVVFPYPEGDFFDDGIPGGVISPSGFSTYRKCPKQYYYAYVCGMRKPPGIAMLKGKTIHKGAEVVHKHTIASGQPMCIDQAVQEVSDYWDESVTEVEDWDDDSSDEPVKVDPGHIKDITIRNFRAYYNQAVPLIQPVAAEKAFALKIGTVPVRGIIDLIDSIPGEYSLEDDPNAPPPKIEVVADLKTTTRKWVPQKLAYDTQMTIYAMVENTPHIRVDLLLDQKSGTKYCPMRTTRTRNEKKVLIEDLEYVVDLIKQGIFPRCDPTAWNCTNKFCGYYHICRGE